MPTKTTPEDKNLERAHATPTGLQSVTNVMIPVTDPDRAIEFYTHSLGFGVAADRPYGDGQRWIEVAPPGGETTLALVPSHGDYTAGSHTGAVLRTADAGATHTRLNQNSVETDARIMGGGDVPSFFWFRDQDGNTLMVVEDS